MLLLGSLSACVNLKPQVDTSRTYLLGPIDVPSTDVTILYDLYIARPNLPSYAESTHLYYRNVQSELKNLKGVRWGESMHEGIVRALSEWVVSSCGMQVGGVYPWPKTSDQLRELRLQFHEFGATSDGRIHLSVTWKIVGSPEAKQVGYYSAKGHTWTVGDAQSLVAGLNDALAAFARELSTTL
jgi:uncharacterized lipoprotein YmbA